MAVKSWLKLVGALKKFLNEVGAIFPNSTTLSGYGSSGPYHCSDCTYLKKINGKPFRDDKNMGRCDHPVVISDFEVPRDGKLSVVNIEHGCCAFVDYPEGFVEGAEEKD